MNWQDLLATPDDVVTVPWTGGREIRAQHRVFQIAGRVPSSHGWHTFTVTGGRKASWKGPVEPDIETLFTGVKFTKGYLVGDRFVADAIHVSDDPFEILRQTEPVYLVEPGLGRFTRVRVARWEDGRLIYVGQEFPIGPESAVAGAYLDQDVSVSSISGVTPALDATFRIETWNRIELVRVRAEAERLAREEALRLELAARRDQLVRQLGDGAGRRQMAVVDFNAAVGAALKVGGAELLDWRDAAMADEAVVQFKFKDRKFECVCQKSSLRIIDAGICLTDHASGRRDDNLLTVESLPGVIDHAIREHKLVIYRHVDARGGYVRDDGNFERDYDDED